MERKYETILMYAKVISKTITYSAITLIAFQLLNIRIYEAFGAYYPTNLFNIGLIIYLFGDMYFEIKNYNLNIIKND